MKPMCVVCSRPQLKRRCDLGTGSAMFQVYRRLTNVFNLLLLFNHDALYDGRTPL